MNDKINLIYANCGRLADNINTKCWLNSLCQQKNKNFRVIIVDSESNNLETDVKEIANQFISNGISCKLLVIKRQNVFNKPLHLNTGALYEPHIDFFCFSDVDMVYSPDFIEEIFKHISTTKYPNRIFGPQMKSVYRYKRKKINELCIDDIKDGVFDQIRNQCWPRFKPWKNVSGGCQCCSSQSFFKITGYNHNIPFFKEDTDFRKRCEHFFGKQVRIANDSLLIFHLKHEKSDYAIKSEKEVVEFLNQNRKIEHNQITQCEIIQEFGI